MHRTTTPPLPTLRLTIRLWCFFFDLSTICIDSTHGDLGNKKKTRRKNWIPAFLPLLTSRDVVWAVQRVQESCRADAPRRVPCLWISDDCVNECTEGPRRIVRIIYYVQQTHHHPPPRGGSTRDLAKMPNPTGTWNDRNNLYTMAKYIKSVCVAHYVPR